MRVLISRNFADTDACLTADPGVTSLIPAQSHTFVEIDHDIISTVILLPSADSRRVVVSYKRMYVQQVLVNCLAKFAQEKRVVRWTLHPNMIIVVDLLTGTYRIKQTKKKKKM